MTLPKLTRREALGGIAGAALAGCTRTVVVQAPQPLVMDIRDAETGTVRTIRRAPGDELANPDEFAEQAELVLAPEVFATVAGGNREPFNRISFRPRANRPGLELNLSVTLFGEEHFTPILIGPIGGLQRYHAEAELAMVQGAAAARTGVVVSSDSSVPLRQIVDRAYSPIWYAVHAEADAAEKARAAAGDGASVIVVSTARPGSRGPTAAIGSGEDSGIDWSLVDSVHRATDLPVVVKGVLTPGDAAVAVRAGVDGIIVSAHGADDLPPGSTPLDALPAVAGEVGGRMPVLLDGSVRRGTDVLKALLLGASATLMSRPAAWALAAYGADGVVWMLDLVQNELARSSVMVGVKNVGEMAPEYVRIHSRATA